MKAYDPYDPVTNPTGKRAVFRPYKQVVANRDSLLERVEEAEDALRTAQHGLHPLVRVTLYVVLFWYVKDLVEQIIWSIT